MEQTASIMSDFLQRAMEGMSSKDPEVRMTSATEIHHVGRALADHAVFPWWEDSELFSLLEGAHPFVTVGLAVTPERFKKIHEAYGLPRLAEVPPDQDAREFELHLPGGLSMDVLTSRDPNGEGAIAKFLKKFGEGCLSRNADPDAEIYAQACLSRSALRRGRNSHQFLPALRPRCK
jgi:hypothetical protein